MFDDLPQWQLIVTLVLCVIAAGYTADRLFQIIIARRRLAFVLDTNMATGHALQKLTANRNRARLQGDARTFAPRKVSISVSRSGAK